MSFPPFILLRLTVDCALTQLYNQLLTRVTSSYICTLKTHICTRYLARNLMCNKYPYMSVFNVHIQMSVFNVHIHICLYLMYISRYVCI